MVTTSNLPSPLKYPPPPPLRTASQSTPVSGGDRGAKNGTLAIFASGDEAIVQRLNTLFTLMGKVNYMGPSGKGQFTKLENQITIASMMVGLVEGIIDAHKAGLNVASFLDAISTRAAGSKSLHLYGSRILKRDFEPVFFVNHFVNDLRILFKGMSKHGTRFARSGFGSTALFVAESSRGRESGNLSSDFGFGEAQQRDP